MNRKVLWLAAAGPAVTPTPSTTASAAPTTLTPIISNTQTENTPATTPTNKQGQQQTVPPTSEKPVVEAYIRCGNLCAKKTCKKES